jgi:hypothetical protein
VKVIKTVEARFDGVYCGYGALEITDQDGTEIKIKMTNKDWKILGEAVASKVGSIERNDRIRFEEAVEEEVQKRQKLEEGII